MSALLDKLNPERKRALAEAIVNSSDTCLAFTKVCDTYEATVLEVERMMGANGFRKCSGCEDWFPVEECPASFCEECGAGE